LKSWSESFSGERRTGPLLVGLGVRSTSPPDWRVADRFEQHCTDLPCTYFDTSHANGQLNTPVVHLDALDFLQTCQEPFLSTAAPPDAETDFHNIRYP
jgi:hypothetical protein